MLFALSLLGPLGACETLESVNPFTGKASDLTPQVDINKVPPEQLYNNGIDALNAKNYNTAIRQFELVEQGFPYSSWAVNAQLMQGYTQYLQNHYTDAIGTLDRFIQLHPAHRDIAYAYYLRALSYYEQIADIQRDQKATQDAIARSAGGGQPLPGQRLWPRREAEDRPRPRPSGRQGDGDRSLL